MILIYSNKPYMGKTIAEHLGEELRKTFPNEQFVIINQLYFHNLQLQYPKKLKWLDYPYIEEPVYKFNETDWSNWKPCEITLENTLNPITVTTESIKNVRTLIYADDPFSTNCHNFDLFLKYFFKDIKIKTSALMLRSLDKPSVMEAWHNKKDFYDMFSTYIVKSEIKRYFNFNYNINSMGILGYTLKELGIDTNKNYLSKYALQLLYALKEYNQQKIENNGLMTNITEGQLLKLMYKWEGTGKYQRKNHYEGRLGSEMSSVSIIESLKNMKLIHTKEALGKNQVQITQLGESFLSKLHKDCLDKDLPFRYDLWQEQGLEVAKPKIHNYLKEFFGKQKRKIDNN